MLEQIHPSSYKHDLSRFPLQLGKLELTHPPLPHLTSGEAIIMCKSGSAKACHMHVVLTSWPSGEASCWRGYCWASSPIALCAAAPPPTGCAHAAAGLALSGCPSTSETDAISHWRSKQTLHDDDFMQYPSDESYNVHLNACVHT